MSQGAYLASLQDLQYVSVGCAISSHRLKKAACTAISTAKLIKAQGLLSLCACATCVYTRMCVGEPGMFCITNSGFRWYVK